MPERSTLLEPNIAGRSMTRSWRGLFAATIGGRQTSPTLLNLLTDLD